MVVVVVVVVVAAIMIVKVVAVLLGVVVIMEIKSIYANGRLSICNHNNTNTTKKNTP